MKYYLYTKYYVDRKYHCCEKNQEFVPQVLKQVLFYLVEECRNWAGEAWASVPASVRLEARAGALSKADPTIKNISVLLKRNFFY